MAPTAKLDRGDAIRQAVLVSESFKSSQPRNLPSCYTPNRKAILQGVRGSSAKFPQVSSLAGGESRPSLTWERASPHKTAACLTWERRARAANRAVFVLKIDSGRTGEPVTPLSSGEVCRWDRIPVSGNQIANCISQSAALRPKKFAS